MNSVALAGAMMCALPAGADGRTHVHVQRTQASSQDQVAALIYRAQVELVVLSVAVLDDDGVPVTGLTDADFRLSEDGLAQEITLFASSEDAPLDVALVLDTSSSMRDTAPSLREDAKALLSALEPTDCVYLVPFNQRAGMGQWGTPHDSSILATIDAITPTGGTALYDALHQALSNVDRSRPQSLPYDRTDGADRGRKPGCGDSLPPHSPGSADTVRRSAVVLLSDGGDEHSRYSYSDALIAARTNPVPIFSVAIGDALLPARRRRSSEREAAGARSAPRSSPTAGGLVELEESRTVRREREYAEALQLRLEQLARVTGGRLIVGAGRGAVRSAFEEVVGMLRSSYLIGYRAPETDEIRSRPEFVWHEIDVDVVGRDRKVYVRPGRFQSRVDTAGAEAILRDAAVMMGAGLTGDALDSLDMAIRLDPGYWQSHLIRASALLQLGRSADAARDLQIAVEMRPGLGVAHALLADTAFKLGDLDTAWREAIRAFQAGMDVKSLLGDLEARSRRPATLQEQLEARRIFVDVAPTPDWLDPKTLATLLRVIKRSVSESPDMALVEVAGSADYGIILDIGNLDLATRNLDAEIVLFGPRYERFHASSLRITDVGNQAQVAEQVDRAIARTRNWLSEQR